MLTKRFIAIALLTATAGIAHAGDAAKDPKTGKNCVTYLSAETTPAGQVQMNFRNTCPSPFQIRVMASGRTREKGIEAASAETPARVSLNCTQDDHCESAKWQYE